MCGIAGAFNYLPAPPVDPGALNRMARRMEARGPDGAGFWTSPSSDLAFVHRRLAIIDVGDRGAQPMTTSDQALTITFNGEIYNFRDLRKQLEQDGVRFHTESDTEVILELYRRHGVACLALLRGMFAFAIWDQRSRTLLLARDPFGIKPLYVADDGRTVRFASQVKALVAGNEVDRSPDPAAQVSFLLWGHIPEPHTLYRAIKSLPPGYAMTVTDGGQSKTWAFSNLLGMLHHNAPTSLHREPPTSEAQGILADALDDTVSYHMVSDVPVGCFLSAGIDSNVLCATASPLSNATPLQCITLGFSEFDGTPKDESALARLAADHYGVSHKVQTINKHDFDGGIDHLLASMDQPSVDGANTYFVAKAASDAGLKVALSGVGADEIFGGYPSFSQVPKLVSLCNWIPCASTLGRLFRLLSANAISKVAPAKYAGLLEYGSSFASAYFLRRGLFMPWEVTQIIDPDILVAGLEALDVSKLNSDISSIDTPHARVMALEIQHYLRPRLLRDTDWAGMAHSLEIRTPFVDASYFQRIAALATTPSPPLKGDLVVSCRRPVPRAIAERRKSGFNIPIDSWLRSRTSNRKHGRGQKPWALFVAEHFGLALRRQS